MSPSPAIHYRGKTHRSGKLGEISAHAGTPDQMLAVCRPHFERMQLTRIADLTGMDRIGIPVANAIAPRMAGSSTHHGKGLTLDHAKVSAVMEAVERYHALFPDIPVLFGSYRELEKKHRMLLPDELHLRAKRVFDPDAPDCWALGWDLVHQEEVAVPYAKTTIGGLPVAGGADMFWGQSSNGFAAGANFSEALCQALFEVIERDAEVCSQTEAFRHGLKYSRNRVNLDSISFPVVRELLGRIQAAGVFPVLFDCTVDTGVFTSVCALFDELEDFTGLVRGSGASLDPATAMVRAITEAALARCVFNAGMIDSWAREEYFFLKIRSWEKEAATYMASPGNFDASGLTPQARETFEGDVWSCVEKLKKAGLNRVIVFDLTKPGYDLSVIKVVVPGLEEPASHPGPRSLRFPGEKDQ